MRSCILYIAVAGLWNVMVLPALPAVLENYYYRVEITEDWEGTHPPGSLLEFYSYLPPTGDALEGMIYAGKVTAGDYFLSPGIFNAFSATEGVFVSPAMELPTGEIIQARTTLHFRLTSSGLNLFWRVDCDTSVTFDYGLEWIWDLGDWDEADTYSQVGLAKNYNIGNYSGTYTQALRNSWRLQNNQRCLWFLQPDPLQARWEIDQYEIKQVWLHAREAHTTLNASEYPRIASTLSPDHSIWGNVQLEIGIPDEETPGDGFGWLCLSGMPFKAEQGLMFWWDSAPCGGDMFTPMTTPSNPSTPIGQFIVALIEAHPRMKNTMLLSMDRLHSGYPFKPNLPWWSVPESFVCIDTLEQIEGNGALTVSHYNDRATWVTQTVSCANDETLTLSGWIKVDSLGSGWAGIYIAGDSTEISLPEFTVTQPVDWSYGVATFNTGPNNLLQISIGMDGVSAKSRFDDLYLDRSGQPTNMLTNGGFNDFSFNTWFDGEGTEWWHAHSWMHIASQAGQDYLDWMSLIENGGVNYGWEDRMEFGIHCYHHTPNELHPLGGDFLHEWNLYDPEGDSARFEMIYGDLYECGVTDKSWKGMRFAGHRHHLPAVKECVKYGIKLIDRGPNYQKNCLLGPIIMPEGIVWETNTNWWADSAAWVDPELMVQVLLRGDLILGGAHPTGTFQPANPAHWDVVSGVFTDIENEFPYMQYFFAEEFADFCEESRTWWDVEFIDTDSSIELNFYGSAQYGQTAVATLANGSGVIFPPTVDFQPVDYEVRDNRVFIELPELDLGYHSVVLTKGVGINPGPQQLPETIHLGTPYPNPCNAWITFPMDLPSVTEVDYTITDVLGRTILNGKANQGSGQRRLSLHLDDLPSGVYLYRLKARDVVKDGKFTLLK
jgi:hypothetical protein